MMHGTQRQTYLLNHTPMRYTCLTTPKLEATHSTQHFTQSFYCLPLSLNDTLSLTYFKGKYHKLTGASVFIVVMLILVAKPVKNYHASANPCKLHEN